VDVRVVFLKKVVSAGLTAGEKDTWMWRLRCEGSFLSASSQDDLQLDLSRRANYVGALFRLQLPGLALKYARKDKPMQTPPAPGSCSETYTQRQAHANVQWRMLARMDAHPNNTLPPDTLLIRRIPSTDTLRAFSSVKCRILANPHCICFDVAASINNLYMEVCHLGTRVLED
jgi:hypothetical protein